MYTSKDQRGASANNNQIMATELKANPKITCFQFPFFTFKKERKILQKFKSISFWCLLLKYQAVKQNVNKTWLQKLWIHAIRALFSVTKRKKSILKTKLSQIFSIKRFLAILRTDNYVLIWNNWRSNGGLKKKRKKDISRDKFTMFTTNK